MRSGHGRTRRRGTRLGSLKMGHTVISVQRNRTRRLIELLNGDVADIDPEMAATESDDKHDPEGINARVEGAKTSTLVKLEHLYLSKIALA